MTETEFERKWLKTFVPNLTQEQYEACYLNEYLWHAFSYELIPKERVLCGAEARKAYEQAEKTGALTIRLWDKGKNETAEIAQQQKYWKTLDKLPEFYVVAADWSWTYVSTHENDVMGLGPFFYKKD